MIGLEQILQELNIDEMPSKLYQFRRYQERILWWNEKVNLTSIVDPAAFEAKHFVDSLLAAGEEEFQRSKRIVDIGTGGGFPGIPLAIAYPDKEFLLVDSLGKRLKIVEEIAGELEINNVTVLHSRAEDLGRNKKYREKFDLCVSRAVADLAVLSEYCIPLVKRGGNFIAYKGPDGGAEAERCEKAIKLLGGKLVSADKPGIVERIDNYHLEHTLVIIHKIGKTTFAYPRKAGTPAKNPLK